VILKQILQKQSLMVGKGFMSLKIVSNLFFVNTVMKTRFRKTERYKFVDQVKCHLSRNTLHHGGRVKPAHNKTTRDCIFFHCRQVPFNTAT
jgi:hypothetical protein